jgi:hypothetical protein
MARVHSARKIIEVAFGNTLTDPAYTWTDLTPWLKDGTSHAFRRGRQNELQQFDSGDGETVLINNDRRFEPLYAASPYYPNVDVEKPVRMSLEYPWLPAVLTDGAFEYGLDGWAGTNGTVAWVVGGGWLYNKANAQRLTRTVLGGNVTTRSLPMAALPGEKWYTSLRVRPSAAQSVMTQLRWYSDLAGTAGISTTNGPLIAAPANVWTRLDMGALITAPAGTQSVRAYFLSTTGAINDYYDISFVVLDQVSWYTAQAQQQVAYVDDWIPNWNFGDNSVTLKWHDGFKALGLKTINNRAYRQVALSQGVKYYWPLDESNGSTTIHDIGTLNAKLDLPMYGQGIFGIEGPLITDPGTGVDFYGGILGDGPIEYGTGWFNMGDAVAMLNGAWSMSFWFKYTASSDRIIQQGPDQDPRSPSKNFWNLYTNSRSYSACPGGLQFSGIDNNNRAIVFNFPDQGGYDDGRWHFCTIAKSGDNATFNIYVDGARPPIGAVVGGSVVGGAFVSSVATSFAVSRFLLAGANDEPGFSGQLAHVTISPGVLTTLTQHQALYNVSPTRWEGDSISTRMGRVLDAISWPFAYRNIGDAPAIANPEVATLTTTNSLEYLHGLEASDGGWLFMNPDGQVTYMSRSVLVRAPYTQVQWVLSDQGGEVDAATGLTAIPFASVTPQFGDETLYNEAAVSRRIDADYAGATMVATDDASIAKYFRRTAPGRDSMLLAFDSDALALAQWTVAMYGTPKFVFTSVKLQCFTDDQWNMAVNATMGQRVAVWVHPYGPGSGLRIEAVIQGMSASWQRGTYEMTFSLGMTPPNTLLLDDPVYGLLNGTNRLGF